MIVAVRNCLEKQTLDLLDAALEAVRGDLMPRVDELAQKSSAGTLTQRAQAAGGGLVGNARRVVTLSNETREFVRRRANDSCG
jgi:hypothetical protein